jgi:muramoyltetrapeptide carboxypeptidase LdcA involved in peptidoglycan recycling
VLHRVLHSPAVPTKRPRHTITETEELERALAPLRERGIEVSFPALVVRGAEAALADAAAAADDEERRRELRRAFIDHGHEHFDLDVALTVRERAWTHE